ncbi:MAG TPA: beta-L-arabinofuranosidase domain-containing protein, partial [Bacteroidales bacterium]
YSWTGDLRYADYYERALINCILASQSPAKYENMQAGMMTYHQPIKSGMWKRLNDPEDCFWCCTGTGSENHVQYGKFIYSYDKEGIYVNLFTASQVTYPDKKMVIKQETQFPESSDIKFTFISTTTPTKWKVRIRVPYWANNGVTVKINGRVHPAQASPGSYLVIDRFWTTKDVMEVSIPMSLHKESIAGNANIIALMYGPMVLSGKLGTAGLNVQTIFGVNGDQVYDKLKVEDISVPKFKGVTDDLNTWIKPVAGKPLLFQTVGKGDPTDVTLMPYYKQFFERDAIYWETE